jgi:hypothetical protein
MACEAVLRALRQTLSTSPAHHAPILRVQTVHVCTLTNLDVNNTTPALITAFAAGDGVSFSWDLPPLRLAREAELRQRARP